MKQVKSILSGITPFLPLIVVAALGFVGYKLYENFFGDSPASDAQAAASTVALSDLTTPAAVSATSLATLQSQLHAEGLDVGVLHQGYANQLYTWMNTSWVDDDSIIGLINSMGMQTFQLTAIAYGQRELPNYRNAPTHIFEASTWTDLFSSTKLYGSLRYHLQICLTSSEYASLSNYTQTIP